MQKKKRQKKPKWTLGPVQFKTIEIPEGLKREILQSLGKILTEVANAVEQRKKGQT